jgi:hypothetical protein
VGDGLDLRQTDLGVGFNVLDFCPDVYFGSSSFCMCGFHLDHEFLLICLRRCNEYYILMEGWYMRILAHFESSSTGKLVPASISSYFFVYSFCPHVSPHDSS